MNSGLSYLITTELFISIYFSGKLKSIDLFLVLAHTDFHCNEHNVSIELFYGPNNLKSCRTKINDDHGKDNLEWNTVELLGNCTKGKFDMDKEELKFKIHAEKGHESCKDPFSKDER